MGQTRPTEAPPIAAGVRGTHPVLIVDPLHVVRAGIEMLVREQEGFELVGSAATAEEAFNLIRVTKKHTGALILVGLGLSGEKDAFWLIRTLREQFPTSVVVACGANSDKKAISRALFTGADGFVDKGSRPEEFFDVLRRCAAGEIVIGGAEADSIGDFADAIDQERQNQPTLTDRERDVIQVAARGLTARQIGEHLGLSERTVTTHLSRIYRKLGVSTRMAAVSSATRSGLVTSERAEQG